MDSLKASDFELGVIVEHPMDQLQEAHWQTLSNLEATAEILLTPSQRTNDPASRFTEFETALAAFAERGVPVAVTLTPHLPDTPWRAEVDEEGRAWEARQNIFDPAFRAAWREYHTDFVTVYGHDSRIRRVYVAPPSYFGEVEYFMGLDWSNLKVVAYGALGQTAFRSWLLERYGALEALNNAWESAYATWEAIEAPLPKRKKPKRDQPAWHLDQAWVDFMQWRRNYLLDAMAGALEVLGRDTMWELSFKYSHGDTAMTQGTDSAALFSRTQDLPNYTLHMTNPHSLSDLRYAVNHARLYGVNRIMVENDGNRYTRSELEKIVLTGLLTGIDAFNFSSYRHLLNTGLQATETPQALRDLREILASHKRLDTIARREKHDIAFFHSNSSAWARPPHYTNHDVSRVYDVALSNGPGPEVRGYDWGRYLFQPDVIGEQHILDGDLEGRMLLIVPNSGLTLWPEAVLDKVMNWVREGGALVGFGAACFTWQYAEAGVNGSITQASTVPELPDLNAHYPIAERDELPHGWTALHSSTGQRPVLLRYDLGEGAVYVYSAPVPKPGDTNNDAFFRYDAPQQLYRLIDSLGYPFPFDWRNDKPRKHNLPPLNIASLGTHRDTGEAYYVAGAYTGETGDFEICFAGSASPRPAVLLLVGMPGVRIHADDPNLEIERNIIPAYRRYQDPTNYERDESSLIPLTQVRFTDQYLIRLGLAP